MPDEVSRTNPQYKEVYRTIPLAEPYLGEPRYEVDQVVSYRTIDGVNWTLECIADVSWPRLIKK